MTEDTPDEARLIRRLSFAGVPPLDCVIAANGSVYLCDLTALRTAADAGAFVIAADGGLRHCTDAGITPGLLIGDLDSADPAQVAAMEADGLEVRRFSAEKDETDLELALLVAAERGFRRLMIIGGIGDRFDQTVGNLFLLGLPSLANGTAFLRAGRQNSALVRPGQVIIEGAAGDTVSLLPLNGDAEGITTDGLQYQLRGEALRFGPARGMSNVMLTAQASIRLERGLLLLVHTEGRA